MRVGILTWSKSINHGAVLQAYASQELIRAMGCTPVMLNYTRNIDNLDSRLIRKIQLLTGKLNYEYIIVKRMLPSWNKEKKRVFEEFQRNKIDWGDYYNIEQKLNGVMIGSDMVFDFYEGYNPFMYGKEIQAPYCFSYAASFGRTTESLFEKSIHKDEIVNLLQRLDGLGFRDDNTKRILSSQCGIYHATKTIDPVLLYGFSNEIHKWDSGKWKDKKYILVYSYTFNMDRKDEVSQIVSFAKKNNLKVIAVGYPHRWCDESINASPEEFLEMFANAEFVITDTFHGVVFSLITNRQFGVIIRDNSFKVCDVLKEVGLDGVWKEELPDRLMNLTNNPINYRAVNHRISELRKQSSAYLTEQIHAIGGLE